jgi:hypothetical protein
VAKFRPSLVASIVCGLTLAGPALAHHSFAIFDQTQVLEHTGPINDIEWINPHVWLHIDVTNENGEVQSWAFEAGNTGQLERLGWNREAIVPGVEVTVGYRPMKDGSRGGQLMSVTLPDGTQVCSNRGCF